jgi:hypothetical protein
LAIKIGRIVLLAMFAIGMLIGMTLGVLLGLLIAQSWPPPSERS